MNFSRGQEEPLFANGVLSLSDDKQFVKLLDAPGLVYAWASLNSDFNTPDKEIDEEASTESANLGIWDGFAVNDEANAKYERPTGW
jgi:hypothetical protein